MYASVAFARNGELPGGQPAKNQAVTNPDRNDPLGEAAHGLGSADIRDRRQALLPRRRLACGCCSMPRVRAVPFGPSASSVLAVISGSQSRFAASPVSAAAGARGVTKPVRDWHAISPGWVPKPEFAAWPADSLDRSALRARGGYACC